MGQCRASCGWHLPALPGLLSPHAAPALIEHLERELTHLRAKVSQQPKATLPPKPLPPRRFRLPLRGQAPHGLQSHRQPPLPSWAAFPILILVFEWRRSRRGTHQRRNRQHVEANLLVYSTHAPHRQPPLPSWAAFPIVILVFQ